MLEEEHNETDFFNQDFTTATRWEIFIARLEEIVYEWKLPYKTFNGYTLAENFLSFCEWDVKKEFISFDGLELKLEHYCVKIVEKNADKSDDEMTSSISSVGSVETKNVASSNGEQNVSQCQTFVDLMSLKNNWCLLDELSSKTIHPISRWYGLREFLVISSKENEQLTERQRRMLLSCIHLVIGETSCELPFFIRCLKQRQNVFAGESMKRIDNEMEIRI